MYQTPGMLGAGRILLNLIWIVTAWIKAGGKKTEGFYVYFFYRM
jgi:hypothetical protein